MARKILKLSTPREVRRALTRIANMLINDEITPQVSNSIILCCNAVLSSIRTDEQEERIVELERLVEESRRV